MRFNDKWPESLAIVRHGQSAGNVARDLAEAKKAEFIDIDLRDTDVPLSPLGHQQARSIGKWLAKQPNKPNVILTSPYLRAQQTAQEILKQLGDSSIEFVHDERLREREFGILDRLTTKGMQARFPIEFEQRKRLGKFYFRPAGGESWADVILRLRSVLDSLARDYANQRVLIVAHSVVILCLRYLFETMTEQEILKIERETNLANCSLTTYCFESSEGTAGNPRLETFNFVAPFVEETHEPVPAPERK